MESPRKSYTIELNRKSITWDLDEGKITSGGALAILVWLRPSLLHVLQPLVDELGVPLFRLLIAYHSNLGAELDYRSMVAKLGATFEDGFIGWGEAVSASGWGKFELLEFDRGSRRAVVRVRNPWELQMQGDVDERWGCPFLLGKIIGIFSHALATDCWADEIDAAIDGTTSCVDFHVYASTKTITSELDALRRVQRQAARRRLVEMAHELHGSEARQRAILASLGEVVFTLDPEQRCTSYHVPKALAAVCSPPDEVLGRAADDVFPRGVTDRLKTAIEQVLTSDAPQTLSYERERGGETRYVSAKMSALHGHGDEIAGVTVIERDLTEQVLAERALAERLTVVEQQRETIRAMSTPILQVWDGVLALPIIGAVDQQRSIAIMDDLLEAITTLHAHLVILDVTGVDAVDTATADHFGKILRAAGLLGAECFVSGIRATVAQTMAELGMNIGSTRTFGTMQSALQVAILRSRRG